MAGQNRPVITRFSVEERDSKLNALAIAGASSLLTVRDNDLAQSLTMKNALNSVKIQAPTTSSFDLTHAVKLSMNMGDLVPVLVQECMPGDRFRLSCENVVRMAPMLAPVMHRIDVRVEYFFVPNRLVWPNWETFITNGGDQPTQVDPLPAVPYINYADDPGVGVQSWSALMDYMGLPNPLQGSSPLVPEKVVAMAFAAYQLIWQEYYRDQNLQADVLDPESPLVDGNNSTNNELVQLRKRAWESDYFTRALPFAQKGSPVDLPLGNVEINLAGYNAAVPPTFRDPAGTFATAGAVTQAADNIFSDAIGQTDIIYDPKGTLNVGATTINDLRIAFRLQEWLEKNARGGTRYSELIRTHFNVQPQDARLDRPEYIVGTKNPIQISEVLSTTQFRDGTDELAQGTMAGHGIGYTDGNYGKYFCQEHGFIIGIMSVLPKTAYQQGIPRHFLRYTDPTEYPWPTFAHLGEQEIYKRELYAFQGATGADTFGYTPRYMEMKVAEDRVCGDFRTSLDFWHMGRIFSSAPGLNAAFVQSDPTDRIFAVQDTGDQHLWCQVLHHIMATRTLPVYGTPTF